MRQIIAFAAIVALLGGCSDLNPFGSDKPSADADKDKPAVADAKPKATKRVVIARLETKPEADPKDLADLAPAARRDDDPEISGDDMPNADRDFVAYLTGKKPATRAKRRPKRRTTQTAAAKRTGSVTDPSQFELDKIAPGAGPGRRASKIDDAFSADRDFIKVLMTDSKPVRKRSHRPVKRRRVAVRPTFRKPAPRAKKPRVPPVRIARRLAPKPVARHRTTQKVVRHKKPALKPTGSALATLDGGEAADKEVLKVLGGK